MVIDQEQVASLSFLRATSQYAPAVLWCLYEESLGCNKPSVYMIWKHGASKYIEKAKEIKQINGQKIVRCDMAAKEANFMD